MNKIKVDKKTILTVASAVLGAGSFLVNVLMSKDKQKKLHRELLKLWKRSRNLLKSRK